MRTTAGVQDYLRRNGTPGTLAIIGAALVTFVISWLMQGQLHDPLQFWTDWSQPWGLLTYPFASTGAGLGLFWFLIELYWLFWVGSSAEMDLGTPKFLGFFFVSSALAAVFIWLGMLMIHPGVSLPIAHPLGLPIAALTVAWGTRHPHQSILLFAIIPVPGWLLAWLMVALTLFGFGSEYQAPLMGLFACLHLGLAYLFAMNKLPIPYSRGGAFAGVSLRNAKASERKDRRFYDDVKKREQEREERERLRKLFESSMDDPDKP